MKDTGFFNKYFTEANISNAYEVVYEYIYILCDYSFNYCPTHYQMLYFYFPIFFLYIRSKRKDKSFHTIEHSTLNYIYLVTNKFFRKIINVNFVIFLVNLFFKKVFLYLKTIFLKTVWFRIKAAKQILQKNHPWLTWKPVFKKFSYFGLFSFIRSKWYKNK